MLFDSPHAPDLDSSARLPRRIEPVDCREPGKAQHDDSREMPMTAGGRGFSPGYLPFDGRYASPAELDRVLDRGRRRPARLERPALLRPIDE